MSVTMNDEKQPCPICGEPTSGIVAGWWGECPNCLFLIEQLGMTVEQVKETRANRIANESKKDTEE